MAGIDFCAKRKLRVAQIIGDDRSTQIILLDEITKTASHNAAM